MNNTKPRTTTKYNVYPYVLCALFAALTAVCTFINIPLPFTPVPINLATLSVFLAGGLLGPKYGPISIIVYLLVGSVGMPVFSNFQGGIGVLAGPTGGFLIGYALAALVVGLIVKALLPIEKKEPGNMNLKITMACVAGMLTYFFTGTAWFMILTGTGIWAALTACVFPFLIGDALKIAAAVFLISRLRRTVWSLVSIN